MINWVAPTILALLNLTSLNIVSNLFSFDVLLIFLVFTTQVYIVSKISWNRNIGSIFFHLYLQYSLISSPIASHLLSNNITDLSGSILAFRLGLILQLLQIAALYVIKKIAQKNESVRNPKPSSSSATINFFTTFFFIAIFLISFISFKLGVSSMGVAAPNLPYKLEPLLNIFRSVVIPVLFVYVWNILPNQKRVKLLFLLGMSLWAIFEVYAKGSRSFILAAFTPFFINYLYYTKPNLKIISIGGIVLIILLPINFIFGAYFRGQHIDPSNTTSINFDTKNLLHSMNEIYFRIFPDSVLIQKFTPYIPHESLTNWDLYKEYKGGSMYHTHIIDNVPQTQSHSSGISGLSDGYLLAGIWGFVFSGLFLISCFSFVDHLPSHFKSFRVMALYYLINLTILADGLWSFIFFRSLFTTLALPISALCFSLILRLTLYKDKNNPFTL